MGVVAPTRRAASMRDQPVSDGPRDLPVSRPGPAVPLEPVSAKNMVEAIRGHIRETRAVARTASWRMLFNGSIFIYDSTATRARAYARALHALRTDPQDEDVKREAVEARRVFADAF